LVVKLIAFQEIAQEILCRHIEIQSAEELIGLVSFINRMPTNLVLNVVGNQTRVLSLSVLGDPGVPNHTAVAAQALITSLHKLEEVTLPVVASVLDEIVNTCSNTLFSLSMTMNDPILYKKECILLSHAFGQLSQLSNLTTLRIFSHVWNRASGFHVRLRLPKLRTLQMVVTDRSPIFLGICLSRFPKLVEVDLEHLSQAEFPGVNIARMTADRLLFGSFIHEHSLSTMDSIALAIPAAWFNEEPSIIPVALNAEKIEIKYIGHPTTSAIVPRLSPAVEVVYLTMVDPGIWEVIDQIAIQYSNRLQGRLRSVYLRASVNWRDAFLEKCTLAEAQLGAVGIKLGNNLSLIHRKALTITPETVLEDK
jgi:hypothetical protein